MQVEEVTDVPACLPTAEFLPAEELVSLRKPAEETPQPIIGEKLYTRTDSSLEDEALKCALKSYEETLDKKRAGRICDFMQAEWDSEVNVVIVEKLKGKFTQHMGRLINGKTILAPEEAVFLLENNCIEIMNDKVPMSTEEAFSKILKGNLAHERYQVYSHLSKLGFLAVIHQTKAGITEYEKRMNLDKHPLQKKRNLTESGEGEPEKKRLTFTGALSGESEMRSTSDISKETSVTESKTSMPCSSTSMADTGRPNASGLHVANESLGNINKDSGPEEQSASGKIAEDILSDLDQINRSVVSNSELETRGENVGSEVSKGMNSVLNSKSAKDNGNVDMGKNYNSSVVNSQNLNKSAEVQNDLSCKNNESQDFGDSNSQSSKIVDVMEVDTDADTSRCTSEVSRDNFDSNANAASQDSCVSVNNEENAFRATNPDSNDDVLSMSGSSLDEEVLSIDAGSADNQLREDDDEVTLLEVTKKETKPLAVIDLLSDDDNVVEEESEEEEVVVDDDITFIEEFTGPSTSRPTSSREINSKKLNGCKKEEPNPVVSSSKLIPPLTVQFPDLFRKQVVCVARPPLHLLPNHVKPAKEAYVLNLKPRNDQPSFNNRVWNSYRDMQGYQRQRRQRHFKHMPRTQNFSGFQTWNDRNSGNPEAGNQRRPGFGPDRVNSPDVNSNSRSLLGPPPSTNFSRNSVPPNTFPNNIPLSNPATMNCEVTIKENATESMVTSSSRSSHSNNFNFPPGMPNFPLMNPSIPASDLIRIQRSAISNVTDQFYAELQRTCLTVATNMLSSVINRNNRLMANSPIPMYTGMTPPFNPSMSNGFNNSFNLPGSNEYYSMPQQNFGDQQRRFHRGRPFPCRYRNISNKRSWSDVRSAVCDDSSDSDIEEMPISPQELLWDNKGICPLVKPGVRYPVGSVFKILQITQKAKITNKYGYPEKLLPSVSNLEISFNVYPPGFTYRKTCPQTPKYRIVVVRSTDPIPKYSDIAVLQRKWNDGSTLLIAVNDNGDISFQSFNNVSLPLVIPYEDYQQGVESGTWNPPQE